MKTFAVTGATGPVGLTVTLRLRAEGHEVRPIAREVRVPLDDPSRLRAAFTDVDGTFVMVPFNRAAKDLHAWEEWISCGRRLRTGLPASAGWRRLTAKIAE
jgi:nucleoside-diphosphate-sugar epimerase